MTVDSKRIDWLRVALCTVVLCILVVVLFSLYEGKGAEIISELSADGKSPNLVWLFKHVFAAIPVLVMVVASEFFYMGKEKYRPVCTHTEKVMIFGAVTLFVYALMLPSVIIASPETVDSETNEAIKTLWDRTHVWFFAQILPLLIVIIYHVFRIESEKAGEISAAEEDVDEEIEADDEEDNDE